MSDAEPEILSERRGGVLTLSFNRPSRRNALTVSASKLLFSELSGLSDDHTLKVLVLRGRGLDFCCGADIKVAASEDREDRSSLPKDPEPYRIAQLLYRMPAVTVAAIQGGCAGAAIGWACACDIRIASATARFNTAFLTVGMAGDMAGAWFLTRLIGPTRARDLYFLPRKFTSEEAHSMGLLTRLTPDAQFERELNQLTEQLDSSAPLALTAIKSNFLDAEQFDLEAYVVQETQRHVDLYATADRKEAFQAFLDKRRPQFIGR